MSAFDDDELAGLFSLDSGPGPARKISVAEADAMIASVLDRSVTGRSVAGRWRAWSMAAAGIALAVMAGGAIAAVYFFERPSAVSEVSEHAPAERLAPSVAPQPEVEVEVAREPEVVPEVEAVRIPDARRGREKPPAEDLLARANALRGREQWAVAEQAYSKVVQLYPRSQAAYVAAIAAAALRLEHLGNARGALAMYQRARIIAPNGALDADVLFGIAGAHRALKDVGAERTALERLIAAHPKSVFVPSARKRWTELSP